MTLDNLINNMKTKTAKAAAYLLIPLASIGGYGCTDLKTERHDTKDPQGNDVTVQYEQDRRPNGISIEKLTELQTDGDKIVYHNKRKDFKPGERRTKRDLYLIRKHNGHLEAMDVDGKTYDWEDQQMRPLLNEGTERFDYLKKQAIAEELKEAKKVLSAKADYQ